MGRKEMLFLSFMFTHHFCRWKEDLQNLLSMAIQASSGKQRKIKLCFVKVSLYSTGIGFKILWKAKIGDSAVAFVQAFNMLAPELSEGFSAVLVSSPETKPGVAGQGMFPPLLLPLDVYCWNGQDKTNRFGISRSFFSRGQISSNL